MSDETSDDAPSQDAEADAIMQAAWDRLEAGERATSQPTRRMLPKEPLIDPDTGEGVDDDEPAPAKPAKPAKGAKADKKEAAEEDGGDEENTANDAPASDAARDAEREREDKILGRTKLPASVIAKLTPEERAQFVRDASKQLGDSDNAFRELREFRSREETPTKEKETEREPVVPIDFAEAVKPLVALGLGEEAEPALKTFATAITEPLRKENGELAQALGDLRVAFGEQCGERSRERLVERFPELEQDPVWERVWDLAKDLIRTGRYKDKAPTIQKRFDLAVAEAAGTEVVPAREQANARKPSEKKRSAGKVTAQSRPKSIENMSRSEREWEGFRRMEKGERPDALRRELRLG